MTATTASLVLGPEHEDLRRGVRRFLQQQATPADVRRLMETEDGVDAAVWRRLAEELGVLGLAVPEELGGAGCGFLEVGLVMEEAGAALLVAPLLSTLLATAALLEAGGELAEHWLPQFAAGSARGTVALPPVAVSVPGRVRLLDDGTLGGEVSYVLDGASADLLLVPVETPDGVVLHAVERGAPGLAALPLQTVDQTRKLARLELRGTPARRLDGDGARVLDRVRTVAGVLLALEQVGASSRVLEDTVAYVKVRNQFNRPIGSFQAVKHRCADMLVEVEEARSAAYWALACLDQDDAELPLAAAAAQAFCSEASLHCAADSVQLHGGIGFTWEHSAHLYLKRAKASQLLFGDPAHHRNELARHLGL